jgi:ankyrin repeat protein
MYLPMKLNKIELELQEENPRLFQKNLQAANLAGTEAFARYFKEGNGDNSDAYRHAYWAAVLQKYAGNDAAKKYLDAHENGDKDNNPLSKEMDLFNNSVGMEISRSNPNKNLDQLAFEVQMALNQGRLRQIKDKKLVPTDGSGRNFHEIFTIIARKSISLLLEYIFSANDLNVTDADGRTPLIRCIDHGFVRGFTLLLQEKNIKVNIRDNYGDTVLEIAAENRSSFYLEKLLTTKSPELDFNYQSGPLKLTALMCAAIWGHEANVLSLLGRFDKHLKNMDGFCAYELALIHERPNIAKILKR